MKTAPKNRQEDLETRKRRTAEYCLGDNVATAVQVLNDTPTASAATPSPLNQILERFANLEKTLGHMIAVNEAEVHAFVGSDTPISRLLAEDVPAVTSAKKDLQELCRRQEQSKSALEKEQRKFDRMASEEDVDAEELNRQKEKKEKLAYELENLNKEVALEQDKLTSTLLSLTSRENRYAKSVYELMKLKKHFYEIAFKTIEVELPNIERILSETTLRPVFGEPLEDHLNATGRTIAFPIALSVRYLLDSGLNDEGLFRISPKQIKLDKVKAHMDSQEPLAELLLECDAHLYSALLKSYLRELPEPLLANGDASLYDRWIEAGAEADEAERVRRIADILKDLSEPTAKNAQYLTKFLNELSAKSGTTKMTPRNIGIVLGPNLLWSPKGQMATEHGNIEHIISAVATLIENYDELFDDDKVDLDIDEEDLSEVLLRSASLEPTSRASLSVPNNPKSSSASSTASTSVESPSPNHKRKASLRTMGKTMGRNIIAKINVNAPSMPSMGKSSQQQQQQQQTTTPTEEQQHHLQLHLEHQQHHNPPSSA